MDSGATFPEGPRGLLWRSYIPEFVCLLVWFFLSFFQEVVCSSESWASLCELLALCLEDASPDLFDRGRFSFIAFRLVARRRPGF